MVRLLGAGSFRVCDWPVVPLVVEPGNDLRLLAGPPSLTLSRSTVSPALMISANAEATR